MADALVLDPARTALLVMDVQNDVVGNHASDPGPLVARLEHLVAAARRRGVRVMFVVVGFRPGYPEASPRNQAFAAIKQSRRLVLGTPGFAIHPSLAPRDDEVVVVKHRVSAFAGTELEVVLRSAGIDTLILSGIATSGVVLSTLRQAADMDYRCVVVSDGCSDRDPEVHRVLVERLFPRQARVADTSELIAALGG
jgi:nicotinamidase-related amidase